MSLNNHYHFNRISIYKFILLGDAINQNMFKNFESFDDWRKSFWCGFSIFFPAVSGFLAGTNKSGELKVILVYLDLRKLVTIYIFVSVDLIARQNCKYLLQKDLIFVIKL